MEMDPEASKHIYERAEKIVAEKVGFFRHLLIFVVVNACLFAVNMLTSSEFYWFLLPLAGWAIVLLAHFLNVYIFRGEKFERWRSKEIKRWIQKIKDSELPPGGDAAP